MRRPSFIMAVALLIQTTTVQAKPELADKVHELLAERCISPFKNGKRELIAVQAEKGAFSTVTHTPGGTYLYLDPVSDNEARLTYIKRKPEDALECHGSYKLHDTSDKDRLVSKMRQICIDAGAQRLEFLESKHFSGTMRCQILLNETDPVVRLVIRSRILPSKTAGTDFINISVLERDGEILENPVSEPLR